MTSCFILTRAVDRSRLTDSSVILVLIFGLDGILRYNWVPTYSVLFNTKYYQVLEVFIIVYYTHLIYYSKALSTYGTYHKRYLISFILMGDKQLG